MTIKELETVLDIPRATIRFYEKEGLISPLREGNGYRDYSDEDVEKLKKIIILRKIGLTVNDIADLFDGAKSLPEALDENMVQLQKQMDELMGAMNLSRKMKEDSPDMQNMDADRYWNIVEEEEEQGHKFMSIAKDIVNVERGVLASYFSVTDCEGKPYATWPQMIRNIIIITAISGCILCLYRGKWNLMNFRDGAVGIGVVILVEMVLSVPLYFLGKKHPWIAKHRLGALFISALLLCVVLIIVDNLLM